MAKLQAIYDTDPRVPDEGVQYMHCQQCLKVRPVHVSPQEWARQQLAVRSDGWWQLRCTRHNINIAVIKVQMKAEETTDWGDSSQ